MGSVLSRPVVWAKLKVDGGIYYVQQKVYNTKSAIHNKYLYATNAVYTRVDNTKTAIRNRVVNTKDAVFGTVSNFKQGVQNR